jgi:hypothetical protein
MQLARAKNIILQDKTEWPLYMAEENDRSSLMKYAITLILVGHILQALGSFFFVAALSSIVGVHWGMDYWFVMHILRAVLDIGFLFVVPMILGTIATSFGGQNDTMSALKVYVYAMTPGWIGGILAFIPIIGWLAALAGGLYGIYLFWIHIDDAMKIPADKKVGYVVVSLLVIIVVNVVIGFIVNGIVGMMFISSAITTGAGWMH